MHSERHSVTNVTRTEPAPDDCTST